MITKTIPTGQGPRKLYMFGPVTVHFTGGQRRGWIPPRIIIQKTLILISIPMPRRWAFQGDTPSTKSSNMFNIWLTKTSDPNNQ